MFSTKQRRPFLEDAGVRERLYAYMATILRDNVDSPAILNNGVENHVHALVSLIRNFANCADAMESIGTSVMYGTESGFARWLQHVGVAPLGLSCLSVG
ncbi:MAG: hypothetical protein AAF958_14855 [Planctomycetota bacterium]